MYNGTLGIPNVPGTVSGMDGTTWAVPQSHTFYASMLGVHPITVHRELGWDDVGWLTSISRHHNDQSIIVKQVKAVVGEI